MVHSRNRKNRKIASKFSEITESHITQIWQSNSRYNYYELQFTNSVTGDGSKTAKIIKKGYYSALR